MFAGEEDRPPPPPEHCPECGMEIPVTVVLVVYDR